MTHNLGIVTQAPRDYDRLMVTDSTPAIFWITSPPNSWYNNSACGGSFGYWFSLPATSIGVANLTAFNVSAFPQQSAIIAFEGNSAHSNSKFGLNIDEGITAYVSLKISQNTTKQKEYLKGEKSGKNGLIF
eukprot:Phypoly_transcript_26735.p1 GENE.Phypoly_transcript_26735~~Phypoly_transcript_26735.p1  ORF type:complete len:148 (+),score=25.42 Phypoly_transcript_26735:54-446(+)